MKKICIILAIVILQLLIVVITVRGDTGPKPSITIDARNMPVGLVYMDLLVENESNYFDENLRDPSTYNADMLGVLKNYNDKGWRPGMTVGTGAPMFGDIICEVVDGRCSMHYSYMGVPDRFKVIVVTQSGELVVSNVVEKKAFQSTVQFDYATGQAEESAGSTSYLLQFITTFIPTLLIEFIVLMIFGFSIRKSLVPFLLINGVTQLMLTGVIIFVTFMSGTFSAMLAYFFFEIIIVIIEAILFILFLKEHTRLRRGIYAVVANAASFAVGIYILIQYP